MTLINIKDEEYEEISLEQIDYYNTLIGHTPFCFFQNLHKPVIVFDYYEQYTRDFIKKLSEACNFQCQCSFEYLRNANVDALCSYDGEENKIIVFEGTVLSIYRFASILSCLYKTILMKDEDSQKQCYNFQVHTIANDDSYIDTSIILSDSIETNIVTDYIAMLALKIIIAHEVGHLLSGHIQYRQRYGEKNMAFSMANTSSNIDNITLQVMEVDADQFSACQIMTILENDLINDKTLNIILSDKKQIFRLVGSAIQCVFYLIGIKNDFWKTNTPFNYTHPPASTRVNLFLDIMRLQMGKERESDWAQIANGVIIAQKNIYAYYGTNYLDPVQFVFEIMGKDQYGSFLLEKWREIKTIFASLSKLPFV